MFGVGLQQLGELYGERLFLDNHACRTPVIKYNHCSKSAKVIHILLVNGWSFHILFINGKSSYMCELNRQRFLYLHSKHIETRRREDYIAFRWCLGDKSKCSTLATCFQTMVTLCITYTNYWWRFGA